MATGRAQTLLTRVLPPATAATCFGYAGYTVWRAPTAEEDLRSIMERDSRELDQRRVDWVQHRLTVTRPSLSVATVIAEVHNMEALGPAGVKLHHGETVDVLEEGAGLE